MNKFKNVMLWVAVGLIFILACTTNIIGFLFGLVAIAIIIPIKKWQELLAKFLKKPIKIIAIILAIILMFASVSSVSEEPGKDIPSDTGFSSVQVDDESNIQEENESLNSPSNEEESLESNASSKDDTSSKENVSSSTSEPSQNTTSSKENTSSVETHIHSFIDATCVSPEKCSCGETKGSAKGHTWESATCTIAKSCTVCGTKEGVALGHKYSNGSCAVCGATDSNYTPPATNTTTYVLNTKNMKFHLLSCSWLPKDNREDTTKSREELINEGYSPCGHCDP